MSNDTLDDRLLEAARGFLSAHQARAGSRVAPRVSQSATEPLRKMPLAGAPEPWKLGEVEYQQFLAGCKLSKQTLREMQRKREKWKKQRTQPARAKLFRYRKRRRQEHKRYISNRFVASNKYKKVKWYAKKKGVPMMTRSQWCDLVDRFEIGKHGKCAVELKRVKQELGFVPGNIRLFIDYEDMGIV